MTPERPRGADAMPLTVESSQEGTRLTEPFAPAPTGSVPTPPPQTKRGRTRGSRERPGHPDDFIPS